MRSTDRSARRGFTLIELLVVIGIIILLASLAVLVAPRFGDSQKSALGASQLQGWLAISKQRAYRDKLISGVRLVSGPAPNLYTDFEYVAQPEDYLGGDLRGGRLYASGDPADLTVEISIIGGGGSPVGVIQPGDYLEVTSLGEGFSHRITGGPTAVGPNTWQLTLASAVTSRVFNDPNWRIVRQPRTLANEPLLTMPAGMCVDLSQTPGSPTFVLFTPWGGVDQASTSSGKIIYWVRDFTKDGPYDGEPTLIVVYTRTGAVAAHPVNPPPATDPFLFTKDGRSSGL